MDEHDLFALRAGRARAFRSLDGFWPTLVAAAVFLALLYSCGGL